MNCLHSFKTKTNSSHLKRNANINCDTCMPSDDNDKYQMTFIPPVIHVVFEPLVRKKDGWKIILKDYVYKHYVNILPTDIQYIKYCHLMVQKIIMMYTEINTASQIDKYF